MKDLKAMTGIDRTLLITNRTDGGSFGMYALMTELLPA